MDRRVDEAPPTVRDRHALVPFILGAFGGNVAIWGALFAGTETLTAHGASALQVQLMALASALPMIAGGASAGRVTVAPAIRTMVLSRFAAVLAAVLLLVAGALALGAPVQVVYVAGLASGVGQLVKMTLYRPELYARAGPEVAARALGLDALLFSAAVLMGPFCMGFILSWGGVGAAFLALGLGHASSAYVTRHVGRVAPSPPAADQDESRTPVDTSRRRLPSALPAILGVTVIFNLFYLPLQGLVPLLSRQFTDEAWQVGILASAAGLGMLTGNAVIATLPRPRLTALFMGGVPLALLGSIMVSQMTSYWLAFAALVVGGLGGSAFAATQATLVMRHTPHGRHSAAMGMVSVAVSVLPLGALSSGLVSQALGTSTGFLLSGVLGLSLWSLWLPMCWPSLVTTTARTGGPAR